MPYYGQGVPRGDYYRGDPFLGALLSKVVPKAATWLAGRVGGSGARAAVGSALGVAGKYHGTGAVVNMFQGSQPGIQLPGGMTMNIPNIFPGGAPFLQPTATVPTGGQCPKGFHLNKADGKHGPAGTYCVRNRKMNVTNSRALRRGLRRAEGFEKLARRTVNALRRGPKKFK